MWSFVVVVVQPDHDRLEGLFKREEVIRPDGLLLQGAKHPLDERVAVGVAIGGATQLDAEVLGGGAVSART